MIFVGIDISKLTFDVAFMSGNRTVHKQFENNPKGHKAFLEWVLSKKDSVYICLEATGVYSFGIAEYLSLKKSNVMLINPVVIHAYSKMALTRNKTDKADARLIANFCEYVVTKGDFNKYKYQPKGQDYEAIQRLVTRCDQLEKSRVQENNRLEASTNTLTTRSIKQLLKVINNEIELTKKAITTRVNKNNQLNEHIELLTSINGIGERTAWSILAYIGDINCFSKAKQISSYAGLTPKLIQSGTSINRSSLSKIGHKRLRKSLYMPALVAIRYNPNLKAVYDRLVSNGKPFDVNYQINT